MTPEDCIAELQKTQEVKSRLYLHGYLQGRWNFYGLKSSHLIEREEYKMGLSDGLGDKISYNQVYNQVSAIL